MIESRGYAIIGRFVSRKEKANNVVQTNLEPGFGAIFTTDDQVDVVGQIEIQSAIMASVRTGVFEMAALVFFDGRGLLVSQGPDSNFGWPVPSGEAKVLRLGGELGDIEVRYGIIWAPTAESASNKLLELQTNQQFLQ